MDAAYPHQRTGDHHTHVHYATVAGRLAPDEPDVAIDAADRSIDRDPPWWQA